MSTDEHLLCVFPSCAVSELAVVAVWLHPRNGVAGTANPTRGGPPVGKGAGRGDLLTQDGKDCMTISWQQGLRLFPKRTGAVGAKVTCLHGALGQCGRLVWLFHRQETSHFWSDTIPFHPNLCGPLIFTSANSILLRLRDFLPCSHSVNSQCCWQHARDLHATHSPRFMMAALVLVLGFHSVPRAAGQILNCVSNTFAVSFN